MAGGDGLTRLRKALASKLLPAPFVGAGFSVAVTGGVAEASWDRPAQGRHQGMRAGRIAAAAGMGLRDARPAGEYRHGQLHRDRGSDRPPVA